MILLPLPPKLIEKKDKNISVFEIKSLYPGYGITIGNALRRILLSSLEGVAVTQVKIKGVQHEFSTVPGVLEDVLVIILNLKKLRFKLFTKEFQRATLSIKGKKKVKGSDFKLPSQVKIVNPDCHVATLNTNRAQLDIEIQIERGIGYESAEMRERKLLLGEIAIDSAYSPVRKVNLQVENMRVKERTDFDRLILEIETDGIISPKEALCQASEILINHFSLIRGTFEKKEEKKAEEKLEKIKSIKPYAKKKKRKNIKKKKKPKKKSS